jgi:large subunit ribosomal protein L17
MRHQKHKLKLGVKPAHRKAMLKNLAAQVIEHGKIKSTHARCKALRSYVEKLVTIAKVDSVANRRLVFSRVEDKAAVQKLFAEVAPKFKERQGGYTRIMKLADTRVGDGAQMSYISFVE